MSTCYAEYRINGNVYRIHEMQQDGGMPVYALAVTGEHVEFFDTCQAAEIFILRSLEG